MPGLLDRDQLETMGRAGLVVVGVSGGPDSTALLLDLVEHGIPVVVAHYDHGLRPGSADDAVHVRALSMRLGVPFHTERRQSPLQRGSRQAAARALRYDFFERTAHAAGASLIALAHTSDDVVEGLVMHLLRGCGVAGLRGMPSRRANIIRPLLTTRRRDVLAFLSDRGQLYLEDPSNTNLEFSRVKVRQVLLPALERDLPGITSRLRRIAAAADSAQSRIERAADALVALGPVVRCTFDGLSDAVATRVLNALYEQAGGVDSGLSRANIHSIRGLLGKGNGGRGVDLPGQIRVRVVGESVQFVNLASRTHEMPALHSRECPGCEEPDSIHAGLGTTATLGFRTPGLRMRPIGGRGTRKVQDIMVDARIPREDRDAWPMVFVDDKLAWIPRVAADADLTQPRSRPGQHIWINGRSPGELQERLVESEHRPVGEPI